MVRLAENPNLRLASCCKVDVVKGGLGFLLVRLVSTFRTAKSDALMAATASSAMALLLMVILLSFLPFRWVSRAVKLSPLSFSILASIDQYSSLLNCSISLSRSQISFSATDCTRPADLAPGNLCHNTGDKVNPTR